MSAPAVSRRDIPPPGDCVGQNESLIWYCGRCGEVSDILSRRCGKCALEREPSLQPWVELAERDFRLASALGGGLDPLGPPHTPAFARFVRSMKLQFEHWEDGLTYDLAALAQIAEWERPLIGTLLESHETSWREVEVWDRIDVPASVAQLERASKAYLDGSARLEAAAALARRGLLKEPIDEVIAREIRQLLDKPEVTERAMRLAKAHPSPAVKQALLYASVCTTKSAPVCAATLCEIAGITDRTLVDPIVSGLGLHVSHFTRQAAFEKLCALVGMKLET